MPDEAALEEKHEPKIDYTYSGQKKLDLGFGFSTEASRPAQDMSNQLSWERMRKVGLLFFSLP